MADVSLRHNEGIASDTCGTAGIDRPIDDDVFADSVVVTDFHEAVVAFPSEILRSGSDYRPLENLVVVADTRSGADYRIRADMAVVANHNVAFDIDKRVDDHIVADSCIGIDIGEFADFIHRCKFLGRPLPGTPGSGVRLTVGEICLSAPSYGLVKLYQGRGLVVPAGQTLELCLKQSGSGSEHFEIGSGLAESQEFLCILH